MWCLDFAISLYDSLRPLVIGLVIDDLLQSKLTWLSVLIACEAINWVLNTINLYCDTRLYTKILREECSKYFEQAVCLGIDDSTISFRTNLIEDFTGFLESSIPDIIKTALGVGIAFTYLFRETTIIIVIFTLIVSIVVLILSFRWQNRIVQNTKLRKDENEQEQAILKKRNPLRYKKFLEAIFALDVKSSDIEAKGYFFSGLMQLLLLIGALYMLVNTGAYSVGIIYATIIYVFELNEKIRGVPDHYFEILDLIDSAERISVDQT